MIRYNRLPIILGLTIGLLGLYAGSVSAQGTMTKKVEINDPGQAAMITELGALLLANDSILEVINVAPAAQRPEAYAQVDLRNGDQVLMANGKRLHSGADLTAIMDSLEVGQEIKLGIKRDGQMRLVSFVKAAPDDQPKGMMMMTMTADSTGTVSKTVRMVGDDSGETEVLADLGVLLIQADNGVKVADLMPELTEVANSLPIKEGDIITAISGKKVANLPEFMAEFARIGAGETIELDFQRDGKTLKAAIIHP